MQMGTPSFSYYKDEETTQAALAGDLFTVGDVGYLDDDGYLFLCDRSSDMIISGGSTSIRPRSNPNCPATRPSPMSRSSASRMTTGARRSRQWSSR
jgi:long-chain acyl-CoA synthetase